MTKRERDATNDLGDDWKKRAYEEGLRPYDWSRAGCAADAVVRRAMSFVSNGHAPPDLSPEALLAQHVKAQLAYLNVCRTVTLGGNVDGDIRCYLNNTLDVNLTNKDEGTLSVDLAGTLNVDVDTQDGKPFKVQQA